MIPEFGELVDRNGACECRSIFLGVSGVADHIHKI